MSDPEKPKFEDVILRLEKLVESLETGGLSLDQALEVYEEGVHLARAGNEMLEGAEKRIDELQASLSTSDENVE
jgi:exodeoxyribonuclease VII small subunit